jgi:hypothetical protein
MLRQEEEAIPLEIDGERKCTGCAHYLVCGVMRQFHPFMEEWAAVDLPGYQAQGPPIDPQDLAQICDAYVPILRIPTPEEAV